MKDKAVTKFYTLESPPGYGRLYGYPFDEKEYWPLCEICGRPQGGGLALPPVQIRFEKRVTIADFIWSPPEVLVVDEVKRAFEAGGVQGIEYLDVKVRIIGTREKLRAKLWHLRLHHAAHAAPQMNIVPIEHCSVCGATAYSTWDDGVIIDESTWDGADIFRLHEDVVGIMATEKIRRIVEREGFTGVTFIPAAEFHDAYPESRPRPPARD